MPRSVFSFLMVGSIIFMAGCSPWYVRDNGAPTTWNDEDKSKVESVYLLIYPAIYDEPFLPQMKRELEYAFEDAGVDITVEIMDRLALENRPQQMRRIDEEGNDIYVQLILTTHGASVSDYKMRFYSSPGSDETFYEVTFNYPQLLNQQEKQESLVRQVTQSIIEKLQERELIQP